MNISLVAENKCLAKRISFLRHAGKMWLLTELNDGRVVGVPLALFPTLLHATAAKRAAWRRIGKGDGFQWPALDLDLSVRGIIAGRGEVLPRRRARSA